MKALKARLGCTLGRWLASRAALFPVAAVDVRLWVEVGSFGPVSLPRVVDALGFFRRVMMETDSGRDARRLAAATRVASPALLQAAVWRQCGLALQTPAVRESAAVSTAPGHETGVQSAALIGVAGCAARTPDWAIPRGLAVSSATARIAHMPQMRVAVSADALSLRECESYVREAQVLKGIAADSGELLAVFRRVPVEAVARLRFIASKKLLFFTMSAGRCSGVCRLHDVAAVRDANGATHLVAHRTRFQTAVLG